jgi:hypothetical protein
VHIPADRGHVVGHFSDVTIEESQIRNVMRKVKGNRSVAVGQCRCLLKRLLEQQHNQDPGMIIHQLQDDEDRLKGVLWVSGEQRGAWIECGSDILIHDNTYNMD